MRTRYDIYTPEVVWDPGPLSDWQIQELATRDDMIFPFSYECINPSSYDLRLGDSLKTARPDGWSEAIAFQTYDLQPNEFVLCHSWETVRIPRWCMALLFSKSSTGRKGLEHLHAGLIDPAFSGELVFEFHNVAPWPITLEAGKRLMQMVVIKLSYPPHLDYSQTGRYQGQTGPQEARQ